MASIFQSGFVLPIVFSGTEPKAIMGIYSDCSIDFNLQKKMDGIYPVDNNPLFYLSRTFRGQLYKSS
jgi:hypothetical protein